jgi:5'-nucleotidase
VGFFRSLPIIRGAKEALARLEEVGYIVRIVTAPIRTAHSASEKLDWIAEHLGTSWCEKTIITRDKTLIRGDILIDDNPDVTGSIEPEWEHILYDQQYNQDAQKKRLTWNGDFLSTIQGALL